MPAIPSHDTAVIDEPWNAGANIDNIKNAVTKTVGQDEWAWYDASGPDPDGDGYPDEKGDYKFPHHQVASDGTPGAANKDACDNALARVGDADIPDADKAGVRAHVQHHLDAFNRKQSALRAEEFAATVVNEPAPAIEAAVVQPGVVSAGFEDVDQFRAEGAAFELLLEKHWAIDPKAGIAVATRLALQAAGKYRSDEQIARLSAAMRQPAPKKQAADGSEIAVIPLRGTITPRGSLFSLIFGGGGGLQMFREQFRMAMADGNVSAIVLDIDSPGGVIDLVQETAAEILGARGQKPITAVANTTCASAAYWIASAADTIVATPSAQVGSIGVFTMHEDYSQMESAMGITTTLISAGQFKTEGNPYEPLSKAAQGALQAEVNDIYGMFTGQVAAGRGVSQKAVQAGYGQGRCLLAANAVKVGMVDRVETLEQTVARLGGLTTQAMDPAATVADVIDDDEDGPLAAQTSPITGAEATLDVSAPPVDYLSPRRSSGARL